MKETTELEVEGSELLLGGLFVNHSEKAGKLTGYGNIIADEVVLAKAEYAHQLAVAGKMSYLMIKSSDAMNAVGIV